ENSHLGAGRLTLVLVAEPAAEAPDLGRQRGALDGPAGHVDFVDALVADVAVAEVPEPVPVVMHQVAVVRLLGGRSQPTIEGELLWRRGGGLEADAPARLAAVPLRDEQPAVLPR